MSFSLEKFTEDSLEATNEAWIEASHSYGMPVIDFEKSLTWAKSHINYDSECCSFSYGVFQTSSNEAAAIVDVVYKTQFGPDLGWLKMLDVSLSPKYSIDFQGLDVSTLTEIYLTAIIGTVLLTADHRARVVKLYGRNEPLLMLLHLLNERLKHNEAPGQNVHSKIEGRWLVVTYSEI